MSVHNCPHCGLQIRSFEPLQCGNVRIDAPGRISYRSNPVDLAPSQFIIAEALIRANGRSLFRSTLANLIDADLNEKSVTKYIERLRAAFKATDPSFEQIECLKGFSAYRWVAADH